MIGDLEEGLLQRFRDELTWFRRMGARFARRHPRVARRLELSEGPTPDPHVERLLEGVAFLTARIQGLIEAQVPEVSTGLLTHLYPHFARPVPAMAVARMQSPDPAGQTGPLIIPKGTQLFAETGYEARTCRFRTGRETAIWPLEVTDVRFERPSALPFLSQMDDPVVRKTRMALRIRLRSQAGPIHEMAPETLRFYLGGEQGVAAGLYDLLITGHLGVISMPNGERPRPDSRVGQLSEVGLEPGEQVLPDPPRALPGYTLLQGYFAFPQQYAFVDLDGLLTDGAEETLDLLILLSHAPHRPLSITPAQFQLGCTPIINLFERLSEPIALDPRQGSHLVLPDGRWERTTEIHHVQSIQESLPGADGEIAIEPLYGLNHDSDPEAIYWVTRREPARLPDTPGTDVRVAFVDAALGKRIPQARRLRARLWCTNRDLAIHLHDGDTLAVEDGPNAHVTLVTNPTPPRNPPAAGEGVWRIISHLSLDHVGLPEGPDALEALRELLQLYAFAAPETARSQIPGIVKVSRRTVSRRRRHGAWEGFCRVQLITLTLDESRFVGARASPVMLGQVLHHLFGRHASINVYTQLELRTLQREEPLYRWPAMTGGDTVEVE